MPITLGTNLTKEGNAISAKYNDLFQKLNVAKAWTNTQSTSSGGTAVVLYQGDILTTMSADNPDTCFGGQCVGWNGYVHIRPFIIINGKIYGYNSGSLVQVGTKSDYKIVAPYNFNSTYNICYAIDTSGKLWYVNDSTETQIGTDTTWSNLGYPYSGYQCGINNGKIYAFNNSQSVNQFFTSLTKCTQLVGYAYNNGTYLDGYAICDGYLYRLSGTTATMVGSDNTWVKIFPNGTSNSCLILNSACEVYFYNGSTLYKQNISNVIECTYFESFCITVDNKLYYCSNPNYAANTWNQLFPNVKWTKVISQSTNNYTAYAIGDGKLYYISSTSSTPSTFTATQIGTDEGYIKLEGGIGAKKSSSGDYSISLAWTGDATTVTHTVYTTKNPQVNDNAYIDTDLTTYSTVKSVNGSSYITDQYRTYDRDVMNDSSFSGIPQETMHEEVSVIDMLRITNPNS